MRGGGHQEPGLVLPTVTGSVQPSSHPTAPLPTFIKPGSFLLVTMTSPLRVVVSPWDEGKLRRGGGGGGDLEGFSVRYRGTVSSSGHKRCCEGTRPFPAPLIQHPEALPLPPRA